ncbi:MAG: DUF444 family protein [Deltaproteobacteria bacterium]|nr:DUF444 family protein [Deltaproteobacteria bacterium]
MSLRIQNDHARFKDIVRGRIKSNLKSYIKKGELIGKQGKDKIMIPVPRIDLPHFRFGDKSQGGVGQGDGQPGDPVHGEPQEGQGQGKAGEQAGEHGLEVDVTLDELADMLGEELALPRIEPKGSELITERIKYTGINTVGPEALKHFKRTYKQALRRQLAMGSYDPKNPRIVPIRDDRRYRTWRVEQKPQANAVIIYMMDVSGSMGEEQKEIVRIESFWLDAWLRRNYDGLESRYIIHDAVAKEVDKDTFFHTRESGGTMISSAYRLCADIIEKDYPVESWNIYPFHFSDGDNWSIDDTRICIGLLRERVLPAANQFGYGQVESPYGSGQFIKDLHEHLGKHEKVVTSEIKDKDAIYPSIKDFLGGGR